MAIDRVALVAGSFDPLTNGHLDVIARAHEVFASPERGHVSSSRVRQIHTLGGAIDAFVPAPVARGLARRAASQQESGD